MSHHLDPTRANKRDQRNATVDKRRDDVFRAAFQRAMNDENTRAVLSAFLAELDIDGTAFNPHGSIQAYTIGKHDAGKWWLNAIRVHCPEREAQLRIESRNAALALMTEDNAE